MVHLDFMVTLMMFGVSKWLLKRTFPQITSVRCRTSLMSRTRCQSSELARQERDQECAAEGSVLRAGRVRSSAQFSYVIRLRWKWSSRKADPQSSHEESQSFCTFLWHFLFRSETVVQLQPPPVRRGSVHYTGLRFIAEILPCELVYDRVLWIFQTRFRWDFGICVRPGWGRLRWFRLRMWFIVPMDRSVAFIAFTHHSRSESAVLASRAAYRLQIGSLSVNNGLSWRFHGENGDICTLLPRLECELDDISRIWIPVRKNERRIKSKQRVSVCTHTHTHTRTLHWIWS